jgi:hypothetical protein
MPILGTWRGLCVGYTLRRLLGLSMTASRRGQLFADCATLHSTLAALKRRRAMDEIELSLKLHARVDVSGCCDSFSSIFHGTCV